MSVREFFLENFAGDLEYHPRRGALYLLLAIAAACFWIFSPTENKFTPVPLVFALGSLTLLGKGIFLLRPSSEGFGSSDEEIAAAMRKRLPSIPELSAQVVQDFGTGGLLLGIDFVQTWNNPPRLRAFLGGACLFAVGWIVRRLTRRENPQA